MKALSTILLAIVFSCLTFYVVDYNRRSPVAADQETVYETVMRTKTLRCGYVLYPPLLTKDPATGKFSGIGFDVVNKIGALTKLNIEWSYETNWPNYPQDLEAHKFDALCTLDFFPPILVGRVEPTQPLFLTTMGVYKKKGDLRFQEGFRNLNDPKVKISSMDGSIAMLLWKSDYPKAELLSMPAGSDYSFILENVATGKADLTIVEKAVANNYIKNNPNKIEDITGSTPLVSYPFILPVARGEVQLASLLNQAISLMQFKGDIEGYLHQYAPGDYLPANPYKIYKTSIE
jgi:ABC-type amino acid transport substrate-binding protein